MHVLQSIACCACELKKIYLKGQCDVYEAVQVLEVHVIFLGPKKITHFIVDATNAREKGLDKKCHLDALQLEEPVTSE